MCLTQISTPDATRYLDGLGLPIQGARMTGCEVLRDSHFMSTRMQNCGQMNHIYTEHDPTGFMRRGCTLEPTSSSLTPNSPPHPPSPHCSNSQFFSLCHAGKFSSSVLCLIPEAKIPQSFQNLSKTESLPSNRTL